MVVHALRFLGKEAVTDEVIQEIRKILTPAERKRLLKHAKYTSTWVPDVVRRIAAEPPKDRVARLSSKQRQEPFSETAGKINLLPV